MYKSNYSSSMQRGQLNVNQLLKRLQLAADNPEIGVAFDDKDTTALLVAILTLFKETRQDVINGRIKGEDGYTPQAGKDYLTPRQQEQEIARLFRDLADDFNKDTSKLAKSLDKRVDDRLKRLRDGDDGVVSDKEIERAAKMARELIVLPDFDALVMTQVTRNGEAIRDALEMLPEGEKLSIEAIEGLAEELAKRVEGQLQQYGGVSPAGVVQIVADYIEKNGGTGGGTTDHGALSGLNDDDHAQYALADGSRGNFASTAQGAKADTAVQPAQLATVATSGSYADLSDTPTTYTQEQIEDLVGAMFQNGTHSNASISYDDTAGTISITASGGGTGGTVSEEEVEDFVGGLVTQGTGISVNYDDANNTLTISLAGESFTTALKNKLDAIEAGATANDTDANLRDRGTHTGTQPASTISDFDAEVSNNTDVAAATSHTSNTSNPHSVTKAQVGLGNVPNTDATQRSNHSGTQLASTISDFDTEVENNTEVTANTTHRSRTDNPHSVTKAQVGLSNVNNTSDADKPVSTAQQTALDGKANSSHTHSASDLTATGGNATSFLRKDNTWTTPTNTTYSEITTAEIDAGTASTSRTISGRRAQYIADKNFVTTTTANTTSLTPTGGRRRSIATVTAQTSSTITVNAPSGTVAAGDMVMVMIKANTAVTVSWNAVYVDFMETKETAIASGEELVCLFVSNGTNLRLIAQKKV
ncbi:hypothetical protein ACMA5I_10305 [Paracoccaceae bacterium GXU_MW_L88]